MKYQKMNPEETMMDQASIVNEYKELHRGHKTDEQDRILTTLHVASLFKEMSLKSVIDVGCGLGYYLGTFKRLFKCDVVGLDAPFCDKSLVKDEIREAISLVDLNKPVRLDRSFDLAISLEVAEHLEPGRAASFVEDLCLLSDMVLFSAAVPGQSGTGHINEQWASYWVHLFESQEYDCFDYLRGKLNAAPGIQWWIKQNALLFAKQDSVSWKLAQKQFGEPVFQGDMICKELYLLHASG